MYSKRTCIPNSGLGNALVQVSWVFVLIEVFWWQSAYAYVEGESLSQPSCAVGVPQESLAQRALPRAGAGTGAGWGNSNCFEDSGERGVSASEVALLTLGSPQGLANAEIRRKRLFSAVLVDN